MCSTHTGACVFISRHVMTLYECQIANYPQCLACARTCTDNHCRSFKMAVLLFKCVLILIILQDVVGDCTLTDLNHLTCFNERVFNDRYVSVTDLKLIDSYISRAVFQDCFPRVTLIVIISTDTRRICSELKGLPVQLVGCKGNDNNVFIST